MATIYKTAWLARPARRIRALGRTADRHRRMREVAIVSLLLSPPSSRPQIMSRRATPGQAAQNQQTIKSLLKLETNKICADCKRNKRQWPPPMPLTRAWYRGFGSHCILTSLFLRPAMGVLELGYLYLHSVLGYPSGNGHTH